jgi:hypothetical protein
VSVLNLFPATARFTDENGRLTPAALRALSVMSGRVGGTIGPSTSDLASADDEDSGLEEMRAEQAKQNDGFGMEPPVVFLQADDPMPRLVQEHVAIEALQTELAGLREEVARLRTQINDILQGTNL